MIHYLYTFEIIPPIILDPDGFSSLLHITVITQDPYPQGTGLTGVSRLHGQ